MLQCDTCGRKTIGSLSLLSMFASIKNTEHVACAESWKLGSWLSSSSLAYPRHTSQSLNCQLTSLGSHIPPPSSLMSTFGHTGWLAVCPKVFSARKWPEAAAVAQRRELNRKICNHVPQSSELPSMWARNTTRFKNKTCTKLHLH